MNNIARLAIIFFIANIASATTHTNIVTFDEISGQMSLTNQTYAGLFWEEGSAGSQGRKGGWNIPDPAKDHINYPFSGSRNVINGWGTTINPISFSNTVDVIGAYFSVQGSTSSWTSGIRVHGYLNNSIVSSTDWFTSVGTNPVWFAINFSSVDRIVVESVPNENGGGWFGMDDFTYIQNNADDLYNLNISVDAESSQAILSWPTNAHEYHLEFTSSIFTQSWAEVSSAPSIIDDKFYTSVTITNEHQFFRLIKQETN